MLLFLSFAADDDEVAGQIAEWLSQQEDIRICSRRGTRVDDPTMTGSIEHKITQSDAFIVIMSPSFLASASCRRERVVALHREPLDVDGRPPSFIQVVEVRPTRFLTAGAFSPSYWVNMTVERDKDTALRELHAKLTAKAAAAGPRQEAVQHEPPSFRNRETELEGVLDELTSPTGQHFWRLLAAPQLGKSWFLDRIAIRLEDPGPNDWTVKLVDARDTSPEVRKDVGALLGMFFGFDAPVRTDQKSLEQVARVVTDAPNPYLCLLDSAELLDLRTASELRDCLSQIRKEVETAGRKGVWLALVVASRREGWDGVASAPRLKFRGLSEFTREVVAKALEDMRDRMEYGPLPADQLQQYAEHVHRLSEGLPALIYRYLDWIHGQRWVGLQHLLEERQFDVLTQPYIEELLSPGSLFGPGAALNDELRLCAREALQLLVPYRLYTHAHLDKHLQPGGDLHHFAEKMGWDAAKLVAALTDTDLNHRPQDELWEVIHPPVRRLLCRYWYPSDASLANAHFAAGQFVQVLSNSVTGSDRAVYFVECLWHKSQLLMLNRTADAKGELTKFAGQLSRELLDSSIYSSIGLRTYAANRMRKDEELEKASKLIGVSYDELINTVGGSQP